MYVYVYVCIYVYMCIYICIYMYVYIYMYMYICIYIYIYKLYHVILLSLKGGCHDSDKFCLSGSLLIIYLYNYCM